jgi:hypothetical protein
MKFQSIKPSLELWVKQLNECGCCDINDGQVERLIREFFGLESRCLEQEDKYAELIQALISWHEKKVADLQLVLDKRDADIVLGNGIADIPAGSETAKGVRIGIILALSLLGELPFSSDEGDDDDE